MMNNLLQSIPSTNFKIIEIYNKIESGMLKLSPNFQRKLVWKKQHKFHFIETILKNYPFPEVYIASSEMDVMSITSSEVVVDGQQRLSTIVDYIKGQADFSDQLRVTPFKSLTIDEKKTFLNYFVSVRDLKNMDEDIVKEIFMRINNTEYSLNTVEKINAQYGDSEFVIFCKQMSEDEYKPSLDNTSAIIPEDERNIINSFFIKNGIFTENDFKRMNSLQYIMTLVATIIESEFFGRNSKVNYYIETYNKNMPFLDSVVSALLKAIKIYDNLELEKNSYWFSRTNTFTLLIELSKVDIENIDIELFKDKLMTMEMLSKKYFAKIDLDIITEDQKKYFEFAKEAVNEKTARTHRSKVIKDILN